MTGAVVSPLNKGTNVTQLAQREKFFLIIFDNPKDASQKLKGWIHQDAFSAAPVEVKTLTCPAPQVALMGDTPFCGQVCTKDADCPSGQACKGAAAKLKEGNKPGDPVQICTVYQHPTASSLDGGSRAPRLVLSRLDAGAPPAPGPRRLIRR